MTRFRWDFLCCRLSERLRLSPRQINSDVVFYTRDKDGTLVPVKVNRTHIGRAVFTKSPGAMTRRDITDQYKFPEGQRQFPAFLEHFSLPQLLISVLYTNMSQKLSLGREFPGKSSRIPGLYDLSLNVIYWTSYLQIMLTVEKSFEIRLLNARN